MVGGLKGTKPQCVMQELRRWCWPHQVEKAWSRGEVHGFAVGTHALQGPVGIAVTSTAHPATALGSTLLPGQPAANLPLSPLEHRAPRAPPLPAHHSTWRRSSVKAYASLHTHVLLSADERWRPLVVAAAHTPPGRGCPAAQLACCPRVGMSRRRTALPRLVSRQERPSSSRQETEGPVQ